jgi:hypothetical protein
VVAKVSIIEKLPKMPSHSSEKNSTGKTLLEILYIYGGKEN